MPKFHNSKGLYDYFSPWAKNRFFSQLPLQVVSCPAIHHKHTFSNDERPFLREILSLYFRAGKWKLVLTFSSMKNVFKPIIY